MWQGVGVCVHHSAQPRSPCVPGVKLVLPWVGLNLLSWLSCGLVPLAPRAEAWAGWAQQGQVPPTGGGGGVSDFLVSVGSGPCGFAS